MLSASSLLPLAQQFGHQTPEFERVDRRSSVPAEALGCKSEQTSATIDSNWRWTHKPSHHGQLLHGQHVERLDVLSLLRATRRRARRTAPSTASTRTPALHLRHRLGRVGGDDELLEFVTLEGVLAQRRRPHVPDGGRRQLQDVQAPRPGVHLHRERRRPPVRPQRRRLLRRDGEGRRQVVVLDERGGRQARHGLLRRAVPARPQVDQRRGEHDRLGAVEDRHERGHGQVRHVPRRARHLGGEQDQHADDGARLQGGDRPVDRPAWARRASGAEASRAATTRRTSASTARATRTAATSTRTASASTTSTARARRSRSTRRRR